MTNRITEEEVRRLGRNHFSFRKLESTLRRQPSPPTNPPPPTGGNANANPRKGPSSASQGYETGTDRWKLRSGSRRG